MTKYTESAASTLLISESRGLDQGVRPLDSFIDIEGRTTVFSADNATLGTRGGTMSEANGGVERQRDVGGKELPPTKPSRAAAMLLIQ